MRRLSKSRAFDLSIIAASFLVFCQIHSATSSDDKCTSYACAAGNGKRSELDELMDSLDERELEDRNLPQIQDPAEPRSTSDEGEDSVAKRARSSGARARLRALLKQLAMEGGKTDLEKRDEDRRYRSEEDRLLLIRRLLAEALELKSKQDPDQE